jgi:hypothetical protein
MASALSGDADAAAVACASGELCANEQANEIEAARRNRATRSIGMNAHLSIWWYA